MIVVTRCDFAKHRYRKADFTFKSTVYGDSVDASFPIAWKGGVFDKDSVETIGCWLYQYKRKRWPRESGDTRDCMSLVKKCAD